MGQAKQRGTFAERQASAISSKTVIDEQAILNNEKFAQYLEAEQNYKLEVAAQLIKMHQENPTGTYSVRNSAE